MATLLKDLLLTKLGVGKLWIKYSHLVVAHVSGKKQGCITFSKDQENEDSKIFSLSLGSNRGVRFQFKQTFECSGPTVKYSLLN